MKKCQHCGGEHWGQRFDNCPFVSILAASDSTEEQRTNATEALEAHQAARAADVALPSPPASAPQPQTAETKDDQATRGVGE